MQRSDTGFSLAPSTIPPDEVARAITGEDGEKIVAGGQEGFDPSTAREVVRELVDVEEREEEEEE